MYLYLVRHAAAGEPDPAQWPDDRDRPLTPDGDEQFREVAAGLAELVSTVDVVLSSPLVRALQTAAILEKKAGWPEALHFDALEPGAQAQDVLDALQPHATASSIALVGHEPTLHELASYLLTGDAATVAISMRTGGVVCLSTEDGAPRAGRALLEWAVHPRILRAITSR
jgi:phosphohistidine phosphatase